MTPTPPPNSRRERTNQIKKEFEAKERLRRFALYGGVTVVVAVLIAMAVVGGRNLSHKKNEPSATSAKSASGQGRTSAPPWGLPRNPQSRVKIAGLTLGQMGTAEHYHAHLDVLIDGQPLRVLANIGIDASSQQMSAVHTHTPDGVIHIEAGTKGQPFTLGQVFTEWNVRLSADQIGSLKADSTNSLTAYVNGKKAAGNPAMIRLAPHQEIAIVYGPKDAKVKVPATFTFEQGL